MTRDTLGDGMGHIESCGGSFGEDVAQAGSRIGDDDRGAGDAGVNIIGIESYRLDDRYIIRPGGIAYGPLDHHLGRRCVEGGGDGLGTGYDER